MEGRSYVQMLNRREAKTDPWGTLFLRRSSLLCLLSPVVRVKLRFQTSSMIILTMCLSGISLSSMQVRPRCQTVSYAAVRLTNTAPAFFLASKEFLMFWVTEQLDLRLTSRVGTQPAIWGAVDRLMAQRGRR